MWSKAKEVIASPKDVEREHIRILERAALDATEFDPNGADVRNALTYLTARCDRKGGVNLYYQGLRDGDAAKLREGVTLIKKQLGFR